VLIFCYAFFLSYGLLAVVLLCFFSVLDYMAFLNINLWLRPAVRPASARCSYIFPFAIYCYETSRLDYYTHIFFIDSMYRYDIMKKK